MPQQHLDRLSGVDAAFLHQEGGSTHMHIGGIARFEGPPPAHAELLDHITARLHLVPRYRQRVVLPNVAGIGLGRQRWVDDPTFNLAYHVRHTALPAPGDPERLRRLAGRLFSQRLDRTKPLWELWLVEGLDDGGFALISKTHHALVDGVSGVDLMTMLFDLTPEGREEASESWHPRPEPSPAQLAVHAAEGIAQRVLAVPLRAARAAGDPRQALRGARGVAGGLGEIARAGIASPARSPLITAIGPHRRIGQAEFALDDFKQVKTRLGGTVNDVVLAVVAGALRHWLLGRDLDPDGLELKAGVPVSTRSADERGALGNRLTQLMAPLPVAEADPVRRLELVRAAMAGVKESRQALGAEVIASMQDFAPPTILAQASRLNFSNRFYSLLVTNIPGPQFPLYLLGRRMTSMFPVAFLAGDRALAVAVMSYDGALDFGLLADPDAIGDLEVLQDGLRVALQELLDAAG